MTDSNLALMTEEWRIERSKREALEVELKNAHEWKTQILAVTKPVFDFDHPEMKLGESKVATIIKFAKERDELKAELEETRHAGRFLAERLLRIGENIKAKLDRRTKERDDLKSELEQTKQIMRDNLEAAVRCETKRLRTHCDRLAAALKNMCRSHGTQEALDAAYVALAEHEKFKK